MASREITLPPGVMKLLGRRRLSRSDLVIPTLTTDERGYPHVCLLSPYQVQARDETTLRLAIYSDSRSRRNLDRTRKVTFILGIPPGMYYVKGKVERALKTGLGKGGAANAVYDLTVIDVTFDSSPKAPIVSQPRFEVNKVKKEYAALYGELERSG